MKRILALTLCCVMLLIVATGCNDYENINKTIELNEKMIARDLQDKHTLYTYTFAEGKPEISNVNIVNREEEGNLIRVSVTAVANNGYVRVALTAAIEYVMENNYCRLNRLGIADAKATPIAAPNLDSLTTTLNSSLDALGYTLATDGTEYYNLIFNLKSAQCDLKLNDTGKSAQLNITYESNNLSLTGYYTMAFGEKGWTLQTATHEGKTAPVLYLQSLEQK